MIVFLVGYMGCGKTTIGRRLARRLGYDFADTDDRIEKQEGADVCDIFHYAGEEYFRKAERGMLEQADRFGRRPGGFHGRRASRLGGQHGPYERSRSDGLYPPFCGADRSAFESSRTLEAPQVEGLDDRELVEFMSRNMAEREPFYGQAALTIDGGAMSDDEILEFITEKLKERNG